MTNLPNTTLALCPVQQAMPELQAALDGYYGAEAAQPPGTPIASALGERVDVAERLICDAQATSIGGVALQMAVLWSLANNIDQDNRGNEVRALISSLGAFLARQAGAELPAWAAEVYGGACAAR